MPKPFPSPIQVGVDACHISRIARLLRTEPLSKSSPSKEHVVEEIRPTPLQHADTSSSNPDFGIFRARQRFLARLFNYHERRYYLMLNNKDGFWYRDAELDKRNCSFVAGRFAAKEAIIKAVRHRKLNFHDIIILPSNVQFPSLRMKGLKPEQQGLGTKAPRAVVLAKSHDTISSNEVVQEETSKRRSTEQIQYMVKWATKAKVDFKDFEEDLRRWEEGEEVQLNISHDGDYAVAVCLASIPVSPQAKSIPKKSVVRRPKRNLTHPPTNPSASTAPSEEQSTCQPSSDSRHELNLQSRAENKLRKLLPRFFL
ncbi:hypothetical protein K3495_g13464 [Podosphaera aphanis]|nr:hypothetical protein K3495_g13464 [Podosphaera aphanis]